MKKANFSDNPQLSCIRRYIRNGKRVCLELKMSGVNYGRTRTKQVVKGHRSESLGFRGVVV